MFYERKRYSEKPNTYTHVLMIVSAGFLFLVFACAYVAAKYPAQSGKAILLCFLSVIMVAVAIIAALYMKEKTPKQLPG
jgi:membrane protease YdiL (CAAX protease family)